MPSRESVILNPASCAGKSTVAGDLAGLFNKRLNALKLNTIPSAMITGGMMRFIIVIILLRT
jgi:hypothetical protein